MSLLVDIGHTAGAFTLDARFEAPKGGVTALFGPSGSGKTTTVNAIAGLITPKRGRIVLNGETVFDAAGGIAVPARKRGIGYVFQDARLFPHLSVHGNLLFGWKRTGRPLTKPQIDEVIALLGLGPLLRRRPGRLSGGERQRVAIGRALLTAPRLLLLDEPLTALDAARREEILRYLERLRDHKTLPMIYVTHTLDEVTRLADAIAVFDHGRVIASGRLDDVLNRSQVQGLAGRGETGAVIRATVVEHEQRFGVTRLAFGGGILTVPLVPKPPGAVVHIRVRARDILISRARLSGEISANNVVPAVITALRGDGDEIDLSLDCGGTPLLARITAFSCDRLALAEGQAVYAIFKTVMIDRSPPVNA